jgi:hypothetical protein
MAPVTGGFWESVIAADMAVPADRPLPDLTAELVTMLGSNDADERDTIAYSVLATWISEGVYDDLLISLGDSICQGLTVGLGEVDTDSVYRRSFSALILAECISRDNAAHLLPIDPVLTWADQALTWFVRERDLRGFVTGAGWAHTVAHGSDLLGELARSRHFTAMELTVLLDVIGDRLLAPTEHRLVHGEDDRLAYATMAILHRNLLDLRLVEAWVRRLSAGLARPTESTATGEWPTPTVFNVRSFLRALYLQLANGVRGHSKHDAALFAQQPSIRADLLLLLLEVHALQMPYANRDE